MASKLQQGISILYDMELNNYLMERSIQQLNRAISSLGIPNPVYYSEVKKLKKEDFHIDWEKTQDFCFIFGLVGGIIGIIAAFIAKDGFFKVIFYSIIFGIIGIIIGVLLAVIIFGSKAISEYISSVKSIDFQYKTSCEIRQKWREEDQARVNYENKKKEILIRQRNNLVARKKDASAKLNQYYNIMRIDINYRNLVPIGYMYEFMRLGIATRLDGSNGLYYLVRQELRADQLKYSLDEISRKLDTIINNQHELYYEISDMNAKCDKMIASAKRSAEISAQNNQLLSQSVANTSIAAYNSERIKEELRFQNFMMIYNS